MDKFMKDYPQFNTVRKDLSSPHFRAFRPFPLGMMNLVTKNKAGSPIDCETLYLERQPNRQTQQGLIRSMIYVSPINAAISRAPTQVAVNFDIWSEDFYDCIMGNYPSIETCLSRLRDPKIANEAAAFHRHFALVKGPIGMILLAYKGDVVGGAGQQEPVVDHRRLGLQVYEGGHSRPPCLQQHPVMIGPQGARKEYP
jgi:hypothetical protein